MSTDETLQAVTKENEDDDVENQSTNYVIFFHMYELSMSCEFIMFIFLTYYNLRERIKM